MVPEPRITGPASRFFEDLADGRTSRWLDFKTATDLLASVLRWMGSVWMSKRGGILGTGG